MSEFVDPGREGLAAELQAYLPFDGREAAMRRLVMRFVRAHVACFDRELLVGHLTGSAWVVDTSGHRALLIFHRKLGRWLQPGGHADGDADLRRVARREAEEETGLRYLTPASPHIYDLDVHRIPERGSEPAHRHYDVRFAFFADPSEPLAPSAETRGARWVALDSLAALDADASVVRLARKTAALISSYGSGRFP